MNLAPLDCLSDDVNIHPVVVADLKHGGVERKVLLVDIVYVPTVPRFTSDQKPSIVFARYRQSLNIG